MKKEDIPNQLRHKNYKPIKIDFGNNMKEDNFNIENQKNKKFLLRKKLLEEFYQSNI